MRRLLAPPLHSIFIPLFGDPYITRTASCTISHAHTITQQQAGLGLASKVTRNLLESLVDKLGAYFGTKHYLRVPDERPAGFIIITYVCTLKDYYRKGV